MAPLQPRKNLPGDRVSTNILDVPLMQEIGARHGHGEMIGHVPGEPSAKLRISGHICVMEPPHRTQVEVEPDPFRKIHARTKRGIMARIDPVLPRADKPGRTGLELEMLVLNGRAGRERPPRQRARARPGVDALAVAG